MNLELWRKESIDSIQRVNDGDISLNKLHPIFWSARTVHGRVRVYHRLGVACAIGNVERGLWVDLVKMATEKELGTSVWADACSAAATAHSGASEFKIRLAAATSILEAAN